MWNSCSSLSSEELSKFEASFHFTINPVMREFLLSHNGGRPRTCNITTSVKERRVASLLNFTPGGDAWEINRRLRKILGPKCIVIGTDRSDNFICLRRNNHNQDVIVWNHITNATEECPADIPVLILQWTGNASVGKE